MAQIRHLGRAPIAEALINFQANASERWKETAANAAAIWPSHTQVEELRQLQFEFSAASANERPTATSPVSVGLLLRSASEPSVHQVRSDGYSFSRLPPYPDWQTFESQAKDGWAAFCKIARPDPLYAVIVRFINMLEFPRDGFKLSRYFTAPPKPPRDLKWAFHGFTQQFVYAIPDSFCTVQSVLALAFSNQPTEKHAFVLDITVMLKEPLSVSGISVDEALREMHLRKNEAFFGALTDDAISFYI